MESLIAMFYLLGSPLLLFGLGTLTGWVFGKISTRVLKELDPNISTNVTSQIQKRTIKGFQVGGGIGGISLGMGLAIMLTRYVDLAFQWQFPMFVSLGFALMGSIGAAIAGSELFRNDE